MPSLSQVCKPRAFKIWLIYFFNLGVDVNDKKILAKISVFVSISDRNKIKILLFF